MIPTGIVTFEHLICCCLFLYISWVSWLLCSFIKLLINWELLRNNFCICNSLDVISTNNHFVNIQFYVVPSLTFYPPWWGFPLSFAYDVFNRWISVRLWAAITDWIFLVPSDVWWCWKCVQMIVRVRVLSRAPRDWSLISINLSLT